MKIDLVFNLNFNLENLPINLKELYVLSYQKCLIKVPFNCKFEERIMNYNEPHWTEALGSQIFKSIEFSIDGVVVDKIDNDDMQDYEIDVNSHTGHYLDKRTKLIYELANYTIEEPEGTIGVTEKFLLLQNM